MQKHVPITSKISPNSSKLNKTTCSETSLTYQFIGKSTRAEPSNILKYFLRNKCEAIDQIAHWSTFKLSSLFVFSTLTYRVFITTDRTLLAKNKTRSKSPRVNLARKPHFSALPTPTCKVTIQNENTQPR